jgi:hypothetical protein
MKKLFTAFLLLPLLSVGQTNWKVGLHVSPNLCYRSLDYKTDKIKQLYDTINSDSPRFGFTAGIPVVFSISDNFELESGLLIDYQRLYRRSKENTSPPSITNYDMGMKSWYLTLPVRLNYKIGENKVQFISSLGLGFGLAIQRSTKGYYYDSNENEVGRQNSNSNAYPKNILNAEISAGILWRLTEKVEIRVQPEFRYSLRGSSSSVSTFRPYTVGIGIELLYNL